MILSRKINIRLLTEQGKNFKWEKHFCKGCHEFMWGHGYVMRYFSEIPRGVYLKRYRCSGCGAVAQVRPEGYWQKLRSSIETIYSALKSKISTGFWLAGTGRQRAGHWLRRFSVKARMDSQIGLGQFLDFCFAKQLSFFT